MKRYWTIAAAIVIFYLVAYFVIEWLAILLLQDPRPLFEGDTSVAAAVGALPPALLYAIAGTTARSSGSFLIVFAVVMLMAGLFWLLGQRLRPMMSRTNESST